MRPSSAIRTLVAMKTEYQVTRLKSLPDTRGGAAGVPSRAPMHDCPAVTGLFFDPNP